MSWKFIVLGALGGLIPDIIRLIKAGNKGNYAIPVYLSKGFFYIILFLQICLGALLVYLLKVHEDLQAVIYGYAAPQLFVSFAAGVAAKTQEEQKAAKTAGAKAGGVPNNPNLGKATGNSTNGAAVGDDLDPELNSLRNVIVKPSIIKDFYA